MEAPLVYFLSMSTRVIMVCTLNSVKFITVPVFDDYLTTFKDMKLVADSYVQILEGKTLGITLEGVNLKKDIALYYSVTGSILSGYGASIQDEILMAMSSYNFSELYTTKVEQLKQSMAAILKVIDENKTPLIPHGITPAFILKLKEYQTSLDTKIFATKDAIDLHKNTKELLEELIKEMRTHLVTKMDKTSEIFQLIDKGFYKTYTSARKVAHHHMHVKNPVPVDPTMGGLAITAMNKETGDPMLNVNFSALSINYTADSDINGEIANNAILPGEYTGILTCEGFIPIEFTFTIKLGAVTELGFIMEPITK